MHTKAFENVIKFYDIKPNPTASPLWFPLVTITLISPTYGPTKLPLYFDTGASVTTLKADLYPLMGLQRWDEGTPVPSSTGGGDITVYQYTATLEVFGKTLTCPVHLNANLRTPGFFVGLLGRDTVFNEFGFGFWERTQELFFTGNP